MVEVKTTDRVGMIRSVRAEMSVPAEGAKVSAAIDTCTSGFNGIKHLISEKPLHRRGDRK